MKQYRADLPAWIFVGGLSGLSWLIFWVKSASGTDFPALAVAIAVSGFAFLWLFSFRIVITPRELVFRSLFHGKRTIKHEEIKAVRLSWKFPQLLKGPLRLIVEPRDASKARPLEINAKVFPKQAVNAVLELGARLGVADDGGLQNGVVLKTLRDLKKQKKP